MTFSEIKYILLKNKEKTKHDLINTAIGANRKR